MVDILAEIRRICDEAAERASHMCLPDEHIEKDDTAIISLLTEARSARKHSYGIYEYFKARIQAIDITHDQYEKAICDLVTILEI